MYILKVNGSEISCPPTSIQPGVEIIKNTERALDGSLCCDVVAEKQSLEIVWDVLDGAAFEEVKNRFSPFTAVEVSYCFDEEGKDAAQIAKANRTYLADEVSYLPYVMGGAVYWQSVTVKLVEM